MKNHLKCGGTILVAVLATGMVAFLTAHSQDWMVNRDWFTFWAGGRGLLNSINIYDPKAWSQITLDHGSTWLPNPIFIYPPPTAVLFAPFSALSLQISSVLWVWLSLIFVLTSVFVIVRTQECPQWARLAPFWALAVVLYLPLVVSLFMGQVSSLVLLLVVLGSTLWKQEKWFAGGFVLGFAAIKPQPVLLFIPAIALWLILSRRWKALLGLVLSLAADVCFSYLLFPSFLTDWSSAAANKVGGVMERMPTLWGLGLELFDGSPAGFWISGSLVLLTLLIVIFLAYRSRDWDPVTVASMFIIPSVLVSPYLWSYDHIVLILPLVIALVRLAQLRAPFWVVALLPFSIDILSFILLAVAALRLEENATLLMPVVIGIVLWISLRPSTGNLAGAPLSDLRPQIGR